MRNGFGILAAAVLAAAAAAGCGGSDTVTVSGVVKLDDQPIKDGVINFLPANGQGQTASSVIKDGAFKATMKPGEMKVEVSASKVVGKKKMYDTGDSPVVDVTEEIVPAKYNTKTELKHTAKGASQTVDFLLTTK